MTLMKEAKESFEAQSADAGRQIRNAQASVLQAGSERKNAEDATKKIKILLTESDAKYEAQRDTHESEMQSYRDMAKVKPEHFKAMETKTKDLEDKLAAVEKRLVPIAVGKAINILTVEYGGQAYTPTTYPAVLEKLYKHAQNGTGFQIENSFFEGDPWQGPKKTCSITYQLADGGAPLHIVRVSTSGQNSS